MIDIPQRLDNFNLDKFQARVTLVISKYST